MSTTIDTTNDTAAAPLSPAEIAVAAAHRIEAAVLEIGIGFRDLNAAVTRIRREDYAGQPLHAIENDFGELRPGLTAAEIGAALLAQGVDIASASHERSSKHPVADFAARITARVTRVGHLTAIRSASSAASPKGRR